MTLSKDGLLQTDTERTDGQAHLASLKLNGVVAADTVLETAAEDQVQKRSWE